MNSASKNNDSQNNPVSFRHWLYTQNSSTSDETHAFRHVRRYGTQSSAWLPPAGMKETLRNAKSLMSQNTLYIND
jgi:hypothetical protein